MKVFAVVNGDAFAGPVAVDVDGPTCGYPGNPLTNCGGPGIAKVAAAAAAAAAEGGPNSKYVPD